jgi:GLPGLI family protein
MTGKLIFVLALLTIISAQLTAQISSGKIVYERKTNLYKKYKDDNVQNWIKEIDKIKIDVFELYFNDSLSAFKPQENDLKETYSWATAKNSVYQNFKTGSRYSIKNIWGEYLNVTDTLYRRTWKMTESRRNISGYNCRKAIWAYNDSTKIYAWYCDEIIAGVGPESFYGLPGAILGLASEDGGVIYFAKSVEPIKQDAATLLPQKTKDKIYTSTELKAKLEKDYGKEKWGKEMLKNVFGFW